MSLCCPVNHVLKLFAAVGPSSCGSIKNMIIYLDTKNILLPLQYNLSQASSSLAYYMNVFRLDFFSQPVASREDNIEHVLMSHATRCVLQITTPPKLQVRNTLIHEAEEKKNERNVKMDEVFERWEVTEHCSPSLDKHWTSFFNRLPQFCCHKGCNSKSFLHSPFHYTTAHLLSHLNTSLRTRSVHNAIVHATILQYVLCHLSVINATFPFTSFFPSYKITPRLAHITQIQ